jgi:hypothetical protein
MPVVKCQVPPPEAPLEAEQRRASHWSRGPVTWPDEARCCASKEPITEAANRIHPPGHGDNDVARRVERDAATGTKRREKKVGTFVALLRAHTAAVAATQLAHLTEHDAAPQDQIRLDLDDSYVANIALVPAGRPRATAFVAKRSSAGWRAGASLVAAALVRSGDHRQTNAIARAGLVADALVTGSETRDGRQNYKLHRQGCRPIFHAPSAIGGARTAFVAIQMKAQGA